MSLINRKNCKQLILDTAAQLRPTKGFTRVGGSTFQWLEGLIKQKVEDEIRAHPSVGKTLYLGGRKGGNP